MAPPTPRVVIEPLFGSSATYHPRPSRLNGLTVIGLTRTASTIYFSVPSLGVEVWATGPLAAKVVRTFTRSPRAFVLASGPAPAVPSSWRRLSFAGISFAVPSVWPVQRTDTYYPACGPSPLVLGVGMAQATLDTDHRTIVHGCLFSAVQPIEPPVDGLAMDSGLGSLGTPSHPCWTLGGLSACVVPAFAYSVLVLSVKVPGRAKPVVVSIGLGGNGMTARTILFSLRAA